MSNLNPINKTVIANNRTPLSIVGANLGRQYHKPEARATWPDFEKTELAVKQGNNVEIILNRAPRRYRMVGYDIINVTVNQDAVGATNVYLNKGVDGEVCIPVGAGMEQIGKVSDDAIGDALRGNENVIFADANKLSTKLNILNAAEKRRLVELRSNIDKFIQQIDSAISENDQKARTYVRELTESIPKNNMDSSEEGTKIVITNE